MPLRHSLFDEAPLQPGPTNPQDDDPFLSVLLNEEMPGTGAFEMDEHGQMVPVSPEDDLMPMASSAEFGANLAEFMEERELNKLANTLLMEVDDDIESRTPWVNRFRKGFQMMGLTADEVDDGPFPGSSTATMPLISEATVQFWAKALAEMVPPEGPFKCTVLGKPSTAALDRAKRVADFQNYDCMIIDKGWYGDMSRLLFALPYTGSCFKKTYRDQQSGRNVGEYVKAEDFICNYKVTDLETAPRYTHRLWRTPNQLRKAQVAGVYRDIDLGEPGEEELTEETQIKVEANDFDPEAATQSSDNRHELYEIYCELDLDLWPDVGPNGKETGIALPYIVTIDKESEKVLSIYRDWKEADPLKRRQIIFTKYDFLPSDGFYGFGFLHMIGGLQQAATGALRLIIDGSATASLQGGFISKDASMKDQNLVLEPGVWKVVDSSVDDLQKAFFTPPFKTPDAVLYQVLGLMVQRVEKFAATTEMQTGTTDAKNMPVGSTVALLEAGGKVFSTIHKGLHRSLGEEGRHRFELIQVYMPVEGYPYDVEGGHQGILAEDFQPGLQIVPVSDPNIFSDTQRVAQNQAVYDLAVQNPDLLDKKEALKRVLRGIKVADEDALFKNQAPPPPMDPVSEIQALLRGEPVQAYPDQQHEAYLQHYWAFLNNPQFGGNPQIQAQIGPAAMALMGQRLAYAWAAAVRAMGVPAPMLPPPIQPEGQLPPPGAAAGMAPAGVGPQAGLPPQQQLGPEQIAQLAGQLAPQLVHVLGLPPPPSAQTQGQGAGSGLTPEQEAGFRDREVAASEQETAAKVAATNQKAALDARAADIKAQQEQEKLNQIAQQTQINADREARLQRQDQHKDEQSQVDTVAKAEQLQQSRETHAVSIAKTAAEIKTQQQMDRIKGAIEVGRQVQDADHADTQAQLDQDKTKQDIKTSAAKAKQAAKPKPAPKKGAS